MKHKLYTAWIDVEDKLPFESGKCLAVMKAPNSNLSTVAIVYFDASLNIWHDWYEMIAGWLVTHWMALPTLPSINDQT